MHVVRKSANRLRLESDSDAAGVRLDYDQADKRWLVTAYEKDEAPAPADVSRANAGGQDGSPDHGAEKSMAQSLKVDNGTTYRLNDEGDEKIVPQILEEADADLTAVDKARTCLAPAGWTAMSNPFR